MRQFSQHGSGVGGHGGIWTGGLSFMNRVGGEAGHLEGLSAPACHLPPFPWDSFQAINPTQAPRVGWVGAASLVFKV